MILKKRTLQYSVLALAFSMLQLTTDHSSIRFNSEAHGQNLPSFWPYQGIVFDSNGQAIEGSISLQVKIYASLDSDVALWEANAENISVRAGSFSLDLGQLGGEELRQLIEQTQAQYIGITVNNGVEMSPRTRIGSLPYATLSGNALKLNGLTAESFANQDDLNALSQQVNTVQETAQNVQESAQGNQESAQANQEAVQAAQTAADGAQESAQAAQTAADGAQESAQAAQTTANTAQESAQAAQTTANTAQESAQAAQTTANTAQENAQAAQTTANTAQESAQAAQTTANTAQESAQAAQTTANTALANAQAAQTAANGSQATADGAQATADGAQATADGAQAAADAAQETADNALTEESSRVLIESYEYLNADQSTVLINNILDGLGYLNTTQVSQLITDALGNLDVVSNQTFQTQIQNEADARTILQTELSNQINTLNQRMDQLQTTLEQVQQAITTANEAANNAQTTANGAQNSADNAQNSANDAQNSADNAQNSADNAQNSADNAQNSANDANTLAQANTQAHTQLVNTVADIQNQLNTLDGVVDDLPNQLSTAAFVLGVSNTTSNGWFQYDNKQGVRAAGEMCKDSFPNDSNAHFCSLSEIQQALSVGNFNNSINNVNTWVYTAVPRDTNGFKSYCQSFLYNSGHAASGTSLTISTAAASISGGNGIQLTYTSDLACSQQRKILCCR